MIRAHSATYVDPLVASDSDSEKLEENETVRIARRWRDSMHGLKPEGGTIKSHMMAPASKNGGRHQYKRLASPEEAPVLSSWTRAISSSPCHSQHRTVSVETNIGSISRMRGGAARSHQKRHATTRRLNPHLLYG